MSRGTTPLWRPLVVWATVSGAALAAGLTAPDTWAAARTARGPQQVTDLLVAVCASALALALAWLWVVTTLTVREVLTGRVRPVGGRTARRLVLLACGAAVTAGAVVPATAGERAPADRLDGLPLPQRAAAPLVPAATAPAPPGDVVAPTRAARPAAPRAAPADYVVRPGDSLWSIAAARTDGDPAAVGATWRAIWHANRDVVGDDPDLIHPGQALRLPDTATTATSSSTTTEQDGAR